eukprot:EG_transcript_23099
MRSPPICKHERAGYATLPRCWSTLCPRQAVGPDTNDGHAGTALLALLLQATPTPASPGHYCGEGLAAATGRWPPPRHRRLRLSPPLAPCPLPRASPCVFFPFPSSSLSNLLLPPCDSRSIGLCCRWLLVLDLPTMPATAAFILGFGRKQLPIIRPHTRLYATSN